MKAGLTKRGLRSGMMACTLGILVCAQMAGAGPQGTALDDRHREFVPASESEGWTVQYRFVGLLKPGVYQLVEVDADGQEVRQLSGEVVLVKIVRVIEGHPPVDKDGLFRYKSLFASTELELWTFGPIGPWRGFEYEFTGLCRKDPLTGKTMCRVVAKPLWSSLCLPCGVLGLGFVLAVTAASILVKRVVRRLRRQ